MQHINCCAGKLKLEQMRNADEIFFVGIFCLYMVGAAIGRLLKQRDKIPLTDLHRVGEPSQQKTQIFKTVDFIICIFLVK